MWFESGYYPAGAEFDPNAPWNETDPEYCTCPECNGDCGVWYDKDGNEYSDADYVRMSEEERKDLEFDKCYRCDGQGEIEVEPYEPDWDDLDD